MMRPYPSVPLLERRLDGNGALQRLRRRGERGHEAVAHGLDLGAAVGAQALAGDALVLPQHLPRLFIAQPLGEGCGALDVSEEDGDKSADDLTVLAGAGGGELLDESR